MAQNFPLSAQNSLFSFSQKNAGFQLNSSQDIITSLINFNTNENNNNLLELEIERKRRMFSIPTEHTGFNSNYFSNFLTSKSVIPNTLTIPNNHYEPDIIHDELIKPISTGFDNSFFKNDINIDENTYNYLRDHINTKQQLSYAKQLNTGNSWDDYLHTTEVLDSFDLPNIETNDLDTSSLTIFPSSNYNSITSRLRENCSYRLSPDISAVSNPEIIKSNNMENNMEVISTSTILSPSNEMMISNTPSESKINNLSGLFSLTDSITDHNIYEQNNDEDPNTFFSALDRSHFQMLNQPNLEAHKMNSINTQMNHIATHDEKKRHRRQEDINFTNNGLITEQSKIKNDTIENTSSNLKNFNNLNADDINLSKIKWNINSNSEGVINELFKPKKRAKYVCGLDDTSKRERRRLQNRLAAARSRARKNAMVVRAQKQAEELKQLKESNKGLQKQVIELQRYNEILKHQVLQYEVFLNNNK